MENQGELLSKGERIRLIRQALRINQREFADRAGMRESSVSAIETGKRTIGKRIAKDISNAFNVSLDWILEGKGVMFSNDLFHNDDKIFQKEFEQQHMESETEEYKHPESRNKKISQDLVALIAKAMQKKDEQIDRLITILNKSI